MAEVTDHARKRIKQRRGSKHAEKEFSSALAEGTRMADTKGDLKRFLNKYAMRNYSDAVIYKGMVYWHKKEVLITVTPLPQRFLKYLKKGKNNDRR